MAVRIGQTEVTPDTLAEVLNFPIIVMAGMNDTKTTGRYFPKGPRSLRQGETRWHRAHNYVGLGQQTAENPRLPVRLDRDRRAGCRS